jgi:hypothetical protein
MRTSGIKYARVPVLELPSCMRPWINRSQGAAVALKMSHGFAPRCCLEAIRSGEIDPMTRTVLEDIHVHGHCHRGTETATLRALNTDTEDGLLQCKRRIRFLGREKMRLPCASARLRHDAERAPEPGVEDFV